MIRDIEKSILKELETNAVYLYGLPGVGKTHSALSIAKESHKNYFYLDLHTDIDILNAMEADSENPFQALLSFLFGYAPNEANSLLIIDGIDQLSDNTKKSLFEAVRGLRILMIGILPLDLYHVQFDYICSFRLHSFSFREYLIEIGKTNYCEMLNARKQFKKEIPELFLEDIIEEFRNYLICGGFPTAIHAAQLHNYDISYLYGEHKRIVYSILQELYTLNLGSTCRSNNRLRQIIEHFPNNYSQYDHPINLSSIRKGLSYRDYMEEFDYLDKVGFLKSVRIGNGLRPEPMDPGITRFFMRDYNSVMDADSIKDIPKYILQNYVYNSLSDTILSMKALPFGRKAFFSLVDEERSTVYLCCKSSHSLSVARAFLEENRNYRVTCLFPEFRIDKTSSDNQTSENVLNNDRDSKDAKQSIYKISYLEL